MRFFVVSASLAVLATTFPSVAAAQDIANSGVKVDKNLVYRQKLRPEHIDNYLYTSFFTNGKEAYNMKGFSVGKAAESVAQIRINPAGHSMAILSGNGTKAKVEVMPLGHSSLKRGSIKGLVAPTAICYTPDSRLLAVADEGKVKLFDSRSLCAAGEIEAGAAPFLMRAEPEGNRLALASSEKVTIVSIPDRKAIKSIPAGATVVDIEYNAGARQLGILTADNRLSLLSLPAYSSDRTLNIPGRPGALSFHPDGKYAAVALDNRRIGFFNIVNPADTSYLAEPEGNIEFIRLVKDSNNGVYVVYNAPLALKYKRLTGFSTNYTRLLEDELEARMLEWSMMKPFETEEEYRNRVNDETRRRQRTLFANEITTGLAGDLIAREDVTLGGYNPETGSLTVSIGKFADVYLSVDKEDLASFSPNDLEFRNSVYGLTPDDNFELIYTEVYNKANGKTYRFDNLDRQNLDFLRGDESASIPFEVMKQQGQQQAGLEKISEGVVNEARKNSSISEHTSITVSSRVVPATDPSGRRINNYQVDFTYTVDPDYSDYEDFAPGKYRIEESSAARALMQIVGEAFENDLRDYLRKGGKVVINLTGSADAVPISRPIAYDGSFGSFTDEPCRIDGDLTSISVTPASGIADNRQLAFMRAQAVRDHLMHKVAKLAQMDTEVNCNIEVSGKRGGKYRRINVSLTFIDPFQSK